MKEKLEFTSWGKYRQDCIDAMKKSDNFILIISPKKITLNKDITIESLYVFDKRGVAR